MKINRFINNHKIKYPKSNLSLRAGFIDKDGTIVNAQYGMLDTFAIGMPIYTMDDVEIGRLSIGLYMENLDYADKTEEGFSIPVEFWEVKGYKGDYQAIKTYHQVFNKVISDKKEV